MVDLIVLGAVFLDQEFRFMGSVEQGDKRIVELAFQEEERGKDLFLSPGGSAVNTAVQAARLGMRSRILGMVGEDPFGARVQEALTREGVDTGTLLTSGRAGTGVTVILSGRRGPDLDTAMITHLGVNEMLESADVPDLWEPDGSAGDGRPIFFLGDFFSLPRLQPFLPGILSRAQRCGWVTVLDHGRFRRARTPEPVLRDLEMTLSRVDIYLPSEREIQELTGCRDLNDALQEVQDRYGVKWIAVKRGARGCRVRAPEAELDVPGFPVREGAVSALGAGSAFNAAFLFRWRADPGDLRGAGRFGNAAGRLKIVSGQAPALQRLEGFLERENGRRGVP